MNFFECSGVDRSVLNYPTIAKANGAVAQFKTDLNQNLLHAICNFNATQAAGTPTPQNPKTINGVSAVNVICCGKNLYQYDESKVTTGTTTTSTIRAFYPLGFKGVSSLTFSANLKSGSSITQSDYLNIGRLRKSDGLLEIISQFITPLDITTKTLSISNDDDVVFISQENPNVIKSILSRYDIQIEAGTTQTNYSPFNGTTAIINLGGTYYGGTVDAITGKITLTHKVYVFSGSESWQVSTNFFYLPAGTLEDIPIQQNIICSNGMTINPMTNKQIRLYPSYGINNQYISMDSTIDDIQGYFSNGIQFIYELATPIVVYAQNSAEIPTGQGDNNAFCDTGNIDIDYILSVDKYIQNHQI